MGACHSTNSVTEATKAIAFPEKFQECYTKSMAALHNLRQEISASADANTCKRSLSQIRTRIQTRTALRLKLRMLGARIEDLKSRVPKKPSVINAYNQYEDRKQKSKRPSKAKVFAGQCSSISSNGGQKKQWQSTSSRVLLLSGINPVDNTSPRFTARDRRKWEQMICEAIGEYLACKLLLDGQVCGTKEVSQAVQVSKPHQKQKQLPQSQKLEQQEKVKNERKGQALMDIAQFVVKDLDSGTSFNVCNVPAFLKESQVNTFENMTITGTCKDMIGSTATENSNEDECQQQQERSRQPQQSQQQAYRMRKVHRKESKLKRRRSRHLLPKEKEELQHLAVKNNAINSMAGHLMGHLDHLETKANDLKLELSTQEGVIAEATMWAGRTDMRTTQVDHSVDRLRRRPSLGA